MAASANVKISDAWHALSAVRCKIGGSWKTVVGGYVKIGSNWHPFLGSGGGASLTVTQTVGTISGSRSDAGSVTSSSALGIVTNGTAAFTYAWTKVSGDTFTINTATAISTTFTTTLTNGQSKSGVYKLTVTDSLAATASANVTVNLTSTYVPPDDPGIPPDFDIAVDDVDNGDGTRTIHWGIISVHVQVGPASFPDGASGSFTVGTSDHGVVIVHVSDDGNGLTSGGGFSY